MSYTKVNSGCYRKVGWLSFNCDSCYCLFWFSSLKLELSFFLRHFRESLPSFDSRMIPCHWDGCTHQSPQPSSEVIIINHQGCNGIASLLSKPELYAIRRGLLPTLLLERSLSKELQNSTAVFRVSNLLPISADHDLENRSSQLT